MRPERLPAWGLAISLGLAVPGALAAGPVKPVAAPLAAESGLPVPPAPAGTGKLSAAVDRMPATPGVASRGAMAISLQDARMRALGLRQPRRDGLWLRVVLAAVDALQGVDDRQHEVDAEAARQPAEHTRAPAGPE